MTNGRNNMTVERPIAIGDRVVAKSEPGVPGGVLGRTFVVEKINPKNIKCRAEDGGRGISFPASLLLPASEENLKGQFAPRPFQPREFFHAGEIVTLTRPYKDVTTETPLVVLKQGDKNVNVALLGGDNDRYIRVNPGGLVRRNRQWLAERLVDGLA